MFGCFQRSAGDLGVCVSICQQRLKEEVQVPGDGRCHLTWLNGLLQISEFISLDVFVSDEREPSNRRGTAVLFTQNRKSNEPCSL